MEFDEMMDAVRNNEVYLAISGIIISTARLKTDVKFSLPIYTTALKMMTYETSKKNLFGFAEGFEPLLWWSIFLTTIGVGIIIWILEETSWRSRKILEHLKNLEEMVCNNNIY